MSGHADFDEETSRRRYTTAPYSSRHPVPTVQRYQAHKEEREAESEATPPTHTDDSSPPTSHSERRSLLSSAKDLLRRDGAKKEDSIDEQEPLYKAENFNAQQSSAQTEGPGNTPRSSSNEARSDKKVLGYTQQREQAASIGETTLNGQGHEEQQYEGGMDANGQDTSDDRHGAEHDTSSQVIQNALDPRQKRKSMKHKKNEDHTTREVTDPVTHLPVIIHDSTDQELESAPGGEPPPGSEARTTTDSNNAGTKDEAQLHKETHELQAGHEALEKLFPPPHFDATREEIAGVCSTALTVAFGSILSLLFIVFISTQLLLQANGKNTRSWSGVLVASSVLLISGLTAGGCILFAVRGWLKNRITSVWEDQVWDAARKQEVAVADSPTPESVKWLNSLLASVWGLINPDLFTSLIDTLEDVMQASLPKFVRMISVEDLGQGTQAIRILGVRWLPTGAAAKNVSKDGKIKSDKQQDSDRKVSGEGQIDEESKDNNEQGGHGNGQESQMDQSRGTADDEDVAEGMEAEEGDFVNLELAFSYRASTSGKNLTEKSKNAHLYLGFYLPGNIKFPVWVELRGIVGTMRMRLQLCPDPPFFALCTLTLLGQPKADISCVPLMKKGLNIMDLPLISSFVQSSIDAALAEYVAPRSLTLDLKDMLVGDDFKKDTTTRGVVMVRIKQARGFKEGDPSILGLKQGSSDTYVAVGWAKFGKPVWSTRVIIHDMQPVWEETAFVLLGPEELNAAERLQVQLWDSDRMSADDDLGRIEVDLKELMTSPNSNGKMWDRTDGFQAVEGRGTMPGTLDWSVGYFSKTHIQPEQLETQKVEPEVSNIAELKKRVSEEAERKLREAHDRDQSPEINQQKAQDLKLREDFDPAPVDAMIIATPPLRDYPTGIFSIQIHQISGLEYEQINKNQNKTDEGDDSDEGGKDLPSPYCTVILNHQMIFRTRTKPKNAKPFFNAGTERLIRDWPSTQIMISVRDARVHENDPLLGLIYLPLGKIFQERSQVVDSYPLVGGIGYGRARISMVFRSIQLQAPKNLLGWEYGTIQITGPVTSNNLPSELHGLRMKLRTSVNRGKMYASRSDEGSRWTGKHDRPVHLAVRKRYCSCMVIEFRKSNLGLDKTPAFGILWFKDIPDEEDVTVSIPIWRTNEDNLQRGEKNCVKELGEELGTLKVPLKFYRGLGSYHHKLVGKSSNLQDVFEVLSTANENKEVHTAIGGGDVSGSEDSDSSSDSSSDDDDHDDRDDVAGSHGQPKRRKADRLLRKMGLDHQGDGKEEEEHDDDDDDDGRRGPLDQIKDYKHRSEQLHRGHRGLMQWKGARTADWMKTKVEHGKEHLLHNFKHHERDTGIETEV
ncbi:MAG: hypothetical protein Q9163_006345 [Psora crenata]